MLLSEKCEYEIPLFPCNWTFLHAVCRTGAVVMEAPSSHTLMWELWVVTLGRWERSTKGSTSYPFLLNWGFAVSISAWFHTLIFISLEKCPSLLHSLFFHEKHVCSLCGLCKWDPLFCHSGQTWVPKWIFCIFFFLSLPCSLSAGWCFGASRMLQTNTLAAFISTSLSHSIWLFFPFLPWIVLGSSSIFVATFLICSF